MSELKVHDANIVGLTIACAAQRIMLHLEYEWNKSMEYSDVIFENVVGHHFECILEGNIIFDIDEKSVRELLDEEWPRFEAGRAYGWPYIGVVWKSREELVQIAESKGIRAYLIGSSYGMTGFVLAQSVKQRSRNLPWQAPE